MRIKDYEFKPPYICHIEGWGAALAAATVVGAGISAAASSSAANTQAGAEQSAQAQQQGMFNTEQANEAPYMQLGTGAADQLNYLLGNNGSIQTPGGGSESTAAGSSPAGGFGSLTAPFTLSDFYNQSPQYKFNSQQGAQGVLNQASSSQGAESPAALSALESFNQGNANNAYNSAFANYNTQQNNIFGRLNSIATLGSNAGSNSATGASSFSNSIGNTTASIGASQAAGTVGVANSLSSGVQNAANSFYNQNAINQLLNGGSTVSYTPLNDPSQAGSTAGWPSNPYSQP
jgi:hypothetical protein